MRPLILLAALLWLQGVLAEVRWAWGRVGWMSLFSEACLGFPPLCGAPQLVFIMEEGNRSLPTQASTEARRTDRSSLPGCWLLPAGCTVAVSVWESDTQGIFALVWILTLWAFQEACALEASPHLLPPFLSSLQEDACSSLEGSPDRQDRGGCL